MANMTQDVLDIVKYDDVSKAVSLSLELKSGLSGSTRDIQNSSSQNILTVLQFVRFPSLSDEDALDLIRKNLLSALSLPDYDFEAKINTKISFVEGDLEQIDFVENLVKAFAENRERLGTNNIIVEQKSYVPEIRNWIYDYSNYPTKILPRGNFEELEYINHSPNVSKLSSQDRQKLLQILKTYDDCQKFLYPYKSGRETVSETEAFKDFDFFKTLPGLTFEGETDVEPQRIAPKNPSIPPAIAPISKKPPIPPLAPRSSPAPIVDILAERKQREQQKIDKKLDELKKKVK